MAVQQRRKTQTAEYWLEEFAVRKDDLEYLYEWLLELGEPRTLADLGLKIMQRRCSMEEEALLRKSDKGVVYQPQEKYEVGQRVVFAAFDYTTGQVVGVRDGDNARYGPFKVIQVQMDSDASSVREFAAEFAVDHPLNRSAMVLEESTDVLSVDQLLQPYGQHVQERLQTALLESEDFVQSGGLWFLRGLMPEVTPFHMNIAEAMIDERGQPLTVAQLLEEVDLAEAKPAIRAFALTAALSRDARFSEVGRSGQSAWFLSALIPETVRQRPARLVPMHSAKGGEWLNRELRDFVLEIRDEADETDEMPPAVTGDADGVQIYLTYPHRREGTLPLNRSTLRLVTQQPADRFPVTFVDRQSKEEMSGWMAPGEHYAWGLGDWYRRREIPVGSVLELRRGDSPFTFLISCEMGKRKSEWIREAKVFNGRLTFSMQRKAYMGRYDKHLLLDEGPTAQLDPLWVVPGSEAVSLFDHLTQVFPELAKLSGQGTVHAKALYAAVNLTRRSGAVPIFAELTRHACFDPVGDGNWVYDESLRNITYSTVEEMRRRSSSHRQDVIVDTVYSYSANSEV